MVEKGYIDREVAFDKITDLAGMATTKAAYAAIWKSAKELNKIPNADIVKVVRCKDCKYAHYWYGNDDLGNTAYLCDMFETKMYFDDFCSRGEKKGE